MKIFIFRIDIHAAEAAPAEDENIYFQDS